MAVPGHLSAAGAGAAEAGALAEAVIPAVEDLAVSEGEISVGAELEEAGNLPSDIDLSPGTREAGNLEQETEIKGLPERRLEEKRTL